MKARGKIFVIFEFEGNWDTEWPGTFAILLNKENKCSRIEDIVFYNSTKRTDREIKGGCTTVPCSLNGEIEGSIDGYDDGEFNGRILRACGFSNFWFYEIDLDKIGKEYQAIDFIIYNWENKNYENLEFPNMQIWYVTQCVYQYTDDLWGLLRKCAEKINHEKQLIIKTDVVLNDALKLIRMERTDENLWEINKKMEIYNDFEDYINKLVEVK